MFATCCRWTFNHSPKKLCESNTLCWAILLQKMFTFGVVAHFDGRTMKHLLTRHNRTYQDVTGQDWGDWGWGAASHFSVLLVKFVEYPGAITASMTRLRSLQGNELSEAFLLRRSAWFAVATYNTPCKPVTCCHIVLVSGCFQAPCPAKSARFLKENHISADLQWST